MRPSVVTRQAAQSSGNNPFNATFAGTGANRLIAVVGLATAAGTQTLDGLALSTNTTPVDGQQAESSRPSIATQHGNLSIYVFTDNQHPGAGEFSFTPNWSGAASTAYLIYEIQDAAQSPPFINGYVTPASIVDVAIATVTATLVGAQDALGLFFLGMSTGSSAIPTASNVSASLVNPNNTSDGYHNCWLLGYEDTIVETASETYSADVDLNRADQASDNIFCGTFSINPVPPNQPPTADDDTFSIFDTAQNGDTVGTYTANDVDGTIVSYSIDNAALAIDNAGVITIADNTGITAGVDITATVTATDDDGDTDTALITITVTAPKPGITAVTDVRLGETFDITVDDAVDLSAAGSLSVTYGGIACTNQTNVTATGIRVTAPTQGLEPGVNHAVVVTADGEASTGFNKPFLAPTGWGYVVFTLIGEESHLNDPQYIGNPGGDANNIGVSDYFLWDTLDGTVNFDSEGIPVVDPIPTENIDVSWLYLDAQDNYAAGPEAVLTLLAPDTEAPIITLNGAASMVWVQGTAWIDPGATVTDNVDATRSITSSVSPNVNLAGTYVLPYDATDAGGNAAATVNRTVIVSSADTTPNQFAFVDVNNAELNTLYENTQSITGVDAGQTLTAINGQLSNDNGSTWASSVQMVTGQTLVKASITTGSTNSFEHTVVVEVNGITDTFSVTTKAAVTRTFSIGSSDPVVDTAGNNVTYTYPIWALYDKIPEDVTAVIIDSGVNFSVTNGVGSIQTSAAQLGTNYILVARDSGNSPANYIRTVGQVS